MLYLSSSASRIYWSLSSLQPHSIAFFGGSHGIKCTISSVQIVVANFSTCIEKFSKHLTCFHTGTLSSNVRQLAASTVDPIVMRLETVRGLAIMMPSTLQGQITTPRKLFHLDLEFLCDIIRHLQVEKMMMRGSLEGQPGKHGNLQVSGYVFVRKCLLFSAFKIPCYFLMLHLLMQQSSVLTSRLPGQRSATLASWRTRAC